MECCLFVLTVMGTLCFRCNEKADIFSYGIVLWEIITQETPQRGTLRDIQVQQCNKYSNTVHITLLCV